MKDKTLIGIGVVAVVTPLAALVYFSGPSGEFAKPARAPAAVVSNPANPTVKPSEPAPEPSILVQAGPAPKAAIIKEVTPAVLENLAQSVQLGGNENEKSGNKKELWAKAIPIAQNMVDFSNADCEQRNWLTQFVACGKRALEDSPDYYKYANGLATMPRDAQELGSGVPSQ